MKKTFAILLALVFAGKMFAVDVAEYFPVANKFYAEGKFSEAAQAYETILQTGVQSPALLFNYGNAEFKSGNLGQAIAAYRRAELLAPRDSEIRANLDFVRNQVQGATMRESFWQNWAGALTLNEGAVMTAVLFWLTFALLITRQLRPTLGPKLKTATRIFFVLTILSASVLGLQAANHFSAQTAVVISNAAVARSGPFDEAQSAFPLHDGAELPVLDRHEDWIRVADGSGKNRLAAGETG